MNIETQKIIDTMKKGIFEYRIACGKYPEVLQISVDNFQAIKSSDLVRKESSGVDTFCGIRLEVKDNDERRT